MTFSTTPHTQTISLDESSNTSLCDASFTTNTLRGNPQEGIVYGFADLSATEFDDETIQREMHFSPICCPEVQKLEGDLGLTFQRCVTEERVASCLDRTMTLYYRGDNGASVIITTGSLEAAPYTRPAYLMDGDVKEALLVIKEVADKLGGLPPHLTYDLSRGEAQIGESLLSTPRVQFHWPSTSSPLEKR